MKQKEIAVRIARAAIAACLPDRIVAEGLRDLPSCRGDLIVVAIGKAAYTMAKAARAILGDRITKGIVITNIIICRAISPALSSARQGIPCPMRMVCPLRNRSSP